MFKIAPSIGGGIIFANPFHEANRGETACQYVLAFRCADEAARRHGHDGGRSRFGHGSGKAAGKA
jgi:hypothetical protein